MSPVTSSAFCRSTPQFSSSFSRMSFSSALMLPSGRVWSSRPYRSVMGRMVWKMEASLSRTSARVSMRYLMEVRSEGSRLSFMSMVLK